MPIVGVNHFLSILHLSKIMVHIYTKGENINKFAIGYIINPSLNFNNTFRTRVGKCLGCPFSVSKMKSIKNCMMKKNTSIMALIMIYENNGEIPKTIIES